MTEMNKDAAKQEGPAAVPAYLQSYVDMLRNERDECRRARFQAQEAAKMLLQSGEMLAMRWVGSL